MMAVNPGIRTRRGVGGVRLYDHPGVIYPEEMIKLPEGWAPDGRPYRSADGWGLSTREVAKELGCTQHTARRRLHRRKIPFRLVAEDGKAHYYIWDMDGVDKMKSERLPQIRTVPQGYITAAEAMQILSVGRSTLVRYQKRGLLSVRKVRCRVGKGLRTWCFYPLRQVETLGRYLENSGNKQKELDEMRAQLSLRVEPGTQRDMSLPPRRKVRQSSSTSWGSQRRR